MQNRSRRWSNRPLPVYPPPGPLRCFIQGDSIVSAKPLLCLLLASAAVALPAAAPAQQPAAQAPAVPPIAFTERTLGNGLRVIAIRDTGTPNVMTSMWYEVGSKHDPAGRSGFAHLFEHVLSRKTVNMPYNAINRMVDDVGGTRNASTSYDRTNYYEIVPAQYLERMLWTHAERMARPVIDQDVFETERNVVKEELRQRVLAPPYGRLLRFVFPENVYTNLPHRRSTIGSIADLDSATLADARAFHQAYYGPDTATLIVAGNFDPAELDALVDRYFAAIPRRANPASLEITAREQPIPATRRVNATGPTVPLPAVALGFQIPGTTHPDMPAIAVLDAILSQGENSRLDTALVRSGLATQIGTMAAEVEEQGYFAMFAMIASGQDREKVAAELDRTLAALRDNGPTAEELFEAKNELVGDALANRETFSDRAFALGEMLVRTGDPRASDERLAALGKVTAADVQRVARQYLDPAHRIEVRYDKGDGNPESWANPVAMPTFQTVPPATGEPNQLLAEGERQAPPAPGRAAEFVLPAIADGKLGNGMRLIAARTGETPLATMTVLVRAGSAADPRALAGRANLAAAVAEKGTATRTAEQIAGGLERLGASLSAEAADDGTYFSVTAPTATLPQASLILADIVRNASFPQEEFDRERKRALDGLKVALKDPGALAGMLLAPLTFGDAPYGNLSGGTPASLAAISQKDLLDFRSKWWRPELATVIVSGGIDPAAARQVAEQAFGDWRVAGTAPTPPASLAGSAAPGKTLVVDLPGSGQAAVYAVARGISRSDAAYYDAVLANAVLGGSSTARLFSEIRSKRALSYGASSGLDARREGGMLLAASQTKNESAAEVAKVMLDEFRRIAAEPLEPGEVTDRQTLLSGRFQRTVETSNGFNAMIAGAVLEGIEPTEALAYSDRIGATTGPKATAAMGRILAPENISLVIVGDSSKFLDGVKALRPDTIVIPADKLDLATASLAAVD